MRTDTVLGGDPREAHRIGVHHVYQRYVTGGETPEEIAAGDDISVAEVHAALAYAFENADENTRDRVRRPGLPYLSGCRSGCDPITHPI